MSYRYLTGRAIPVPEPTVLPPAHLAWCFGCGPENEHGLALTPRYFQEGIDHMSASERERLARFATDEYYP